MHVGLGGTVHTVHVVAWCKLSPPFQSLPIKTRWLQLQLQNVLVAAATIRSCRRAVSGKSQRWPSRPYVSCTVLAGGSSAMAEDLRLPKGPQGLLHIAPMME